MEEKIVGRRESEGGGEAPGENYIPVLTLQSAKSQTEYKPSSYSHNLIWHELWAEFPVLIGNTTGFIGLYKPWQG